jgi:nucleoside-triphosphatase THEP1
MAGAKVLVSGEIGSGKSTVVRAAMARLGWRTPAGFFTHWGGADRGAPVLVLETWAGECRPVARRVAAPVAPGGLPYQLDAEAFRAAAAAGLKPAAGGHPVVIDELGLIELGANGFAGVLAELFRGPAPMLAVIQRRALGAWLDRLGPGGAAAHRFDVETATRDTLPERIAAAFLRSHRRDRGPSSGAGGQTA